MPLVAGIDCGTSFSKAVVIADVDGAPRVIGRGRARSGVNVDQAAGEALDQALSQANLKREDLKYIATTGFGRHRSNRNQTKWW